MQILMPETDGQQRYKFYNIIKRTGSGQDGKED